MERTIEANTKTSLLGHVEENPGIRYRELLRMTGLANGVLTYHLAALERAGAVKVERQTRMTRYYPINIPDSESSILKFVRHDPIRQIVIFILEHDYCTFNEIVEHTRKAASTVSSHLKRLREADIVSVKYGEYQLYHLADGELVAEVLSKYKASFVDRVVDSYAEMVEEL